MTKKLIITLLVMAFIAPLKATGVVPVFFTIRNVVQTPTTYTFDVYAEVTDTFLLNTYQIYVAYNTAAFGSSIVAGGSLSNALNNNPHILLYDTLWPLPVPKYKLINVVDNTADILAITVDTRLIVPTPACYPTDTNTTTMFVGNTPRPIATITMTFTDNTQPPGVSLYLTLMVDQFIGGNDSCQLVQGDPSILPATFLGVEASYLSEDLAQVSWDVAEEPDVVSYVVEKETDGTHFAEIGRVDPARREHYTFIDDEVEAGRAAYRIRAVNQDGNFTFSETVELTSASLQTIALYPNPASDVVHLKGIGENENWQYNIFDIQGKKLAEGQLQSQSFDVRQLPAGMYFLELHDLSNAKKHSLKFQRR